MTIIFPSIEKAEQRLVEIMDCVSCDFSEFCSGRLPFCEHRHSRAHEDMINAEPESEGERLVDFFFPPVEQAEHQPQPQAERWITSEACPTCDGTRVVPYTDAERSALDAELREIRERYKLNESIHPVIAHRICPECDGTGLQSI